MPWTVRSGSAYGPASERSATSCDVDLWRRWGGQVPGDLGVCSRASRQQDSRWRTSTSINSACSIPPSARTFRSAGPWAADTVTHLRRIVVEESRPPPQVRAMPDSVADLDVVLLTGSRAVGTSTIAFGLAVRRWRANRRTGFLDFQQLGFRSTGSRPATDSGLSIAQLAAMHGLMAARGAELLLVSGHLSGRLRLPCGGPCGQLLSPWFACEPTKRRSGSTCAPGPREAAPDWLATTWSWPTTTAKTSSLPPRSRAARAVTEARSS